MTPTEREAVAWALAASEMQCPVDELDLEMAAKAYEGQARAWLVSRDAAHEWQIRQPIAVSEPEAAQLSDNENLRRELDLTRQNLHRVTTELAHLKRDRTAGRA